MNVGQAMLLVREDYLDDRLNAGTSDDLVSDEQLLRWLAEAEEEACRRKDILFDDTSELTQIALEAGVRAYDFSPKITRIESVWYVDAFGRETKLRHVSRETLDLHRIDWRTHEGTPTEYMVRGRKIYPVPIPKQDGDLRLEVYRTPLNPVADEEDTFEIDEEWHVGLTHWCPYRAFMNLDEDVEDARGQAFFYHKFEETFGPALPSKVRRIILEEPEVTDSQPLGYHYPGHQRHL
jgi:hypothetical protein